MNIWANTLSRLEVAKIAKTAELLKLSKRIGVTIDIVRTKVKRVKCARLTAADVPISPTYVKKLLPIVA